MPIPPVSVTSKKRSSASIRVEMRSRVTPAVGSTMLIRRPASQLNIDDLPTLGLPTIATRGTDTGMLRVTETAGRESAGPTGSGVECGPSFMVR